MQCKKLNLKTYQVKILPYQHKKPKSLLAMLAQHLPSPHQFEKHCSKLKTSKLSVKQTWLSERNATELISLRSLSYFSQLD